MKKELEIMMSQIRNRPISKLTEAEKIFIKNMENEGNQMNAKCICDLKEGEEKVIDHGSYVDMNISLENGIYEINAVADGTAGMNINYCPVCGKDLREVEDDYITDEEHKKDYWEECYEIAINNLKEIENQYFIEHGYSFEFKKD